MVPPWLRVALTQVAFEARGVGLPLAGVVVIARVAVLNRDKNPRPRPRPRPGHGPRPALLRGTTIARRFRCGSRSRHCNVLGKAVNAPIPTKGSRKFAEYSKL